MSQDIKRKILIAAIHYPIASGRYIARAMRRLGHDVKTVGPSTGREVWGMELPEGSEWEPDIEIRGAGAIFPSSMQDVRLILGEWKPDLIVVVDSAWTVIGNGEIPIVVYGVDNHVRDYRYFGDLKLKPDLVFNRLFLAHSNGYRIGEPNVEWLPCGYDPEWHKVTTPWDKRPYHAALIGVIYDDRAKIINDMADAGLRVLAGTGAIMEAYRNHYNQALISICKSAKNDMAQRVFETAAMGNLILSDRVPDMEKLGMIEGVHYVGYDTPEEAVQKALEIVHDWPVADVIAMIDASLKWVRPHTWDARCKIILEAMGL